MTRKFTVTHPDGTVSKRSSKTREYTFAVVVTPANAQALAAARHAEAKRLEDKAAQWDAAADAGKVVRRDRRLNIDTGEYHAFEADLVGTEATDHGRTYRMVNARCNGENLTDAYVDFLSDEAKTRIRRDLPAKPYETHTKVEMHVKDYLVCHARDDAARFRALAATARAEAEAASNGDLPGNLSGYFVHRWSARRDLAEKAVNEFSYVARDGRSLTVVPVDEQ